MRVDGTQDTAPRMLIGALAERVGVNPKTIRYYEAVGLLPPPQRTQAGYRLYSEEDAERLAFIRRAGELGLSLDEIAEILALRERGERPCGYVSEVARQRVADLDRRIAEMRRARDELATLLEEADRRWGQASSYCGLIQHDRPAGEGAG